MVEDEECFAKLKLIMDGRTYHMEAKVITEYGIERLKIRTVDGSQIPLEFQFLDPQYASQIASAIRSEERVDKEERDFIEDFEKYTEEEIREKLKEMKIRRQ